MLGYVVNKGILDSACGEAVINLRNAFDEVEIIAKWLADHPIVNSVDPLTNDPTFGGYTADEAASMRSYFENMESVRTANQTTFDTGRKMSGLR